MTTTAVAIEMMTMATMMMMAAMTMISRTETQPSAMQPAFRAQTAGTGRRWSQQTFRAMNTDVYVWLYDDGGLSIHHVERLFRRYEGWLSRFDPASELSALNRCRRQTCQVNRTLFDTLEAALWAHSATGGLYDPTILPALEAAGYDRSFDVVRRQANVEADVSRRPPMKTAKTGSAGKVWADIRNLSLDPATLTVSRPPGMRLDLGGIGKGWAVDRAADLLHRAGPFFVNAGGDLYAYGLPGDQRGWQVEIEHPLEPGRPLAQFHLIDRALATSSIVKRSWRKAGRTMHHLIDPHTQQPATTDLLSVSVMADRTVTAEVFAKAALILGREAGMALLQATPGIEGLVYTEDDRVFRTNGFPARSSETSIYLN